jgi:hypothetical protein
MRVDNRVAQARPPPPPPGTKPQVVVHTSVVTVLELSCRPI